MASLKSREYIFLLVLSSLITFSLVQGAKCPEGFHRTDKGYCCWPISCSKNQQFQLCTQDEGLDSCRPCRDGLVTPEQINTSNWSYFYDICHVPECECAPEAILDNPLECKKSGIPVCLCNREKWLYGEDPLNCQKANDALKKSAMERGMELKLNGTVGICPTGYFKALSGSSICSPHSKCPEGHSVEFPGTIVQDIKCKPDPSTSVATRPSGSTSPPSTPPDKVSKSANENNSLLPWVLVGLFAVAYILIVVLLIIGICWMKKRQKSADRMKNNVGASVDPESGSMQPLIEENEKKDMSAPTGSQPQDSCYNVPIDSLEASQKQEHLKGKDDLEKSERKKDLSESGQSPTIKDDLYDDPIGSDLDFSSIFDSQPESGLRGDSILPHLSISKESFGGSPQTTSEDLGIGLSEDSKNVQTIQKSGKTQGQEEQPVEKEY